MASCVYVLFIFFHSFFVKMGNSVQWHQLCSDLQKRVLKVYSMILQANISFLFQPFFWIMKGFFFPDSKSSNVNKVRVMVCNVTFKNISVMSWLSVWLVEDTRENDRQQVVTDKLYHIMLYWVHLVWSGFELTMLVVIGTDYIGSCKFNKSIFVYIQKDDCYGL